MKEGLPEIGDNVWHWHFGGGWITSFSRTGITVEFYGFCRQDDPCHELSRSEFCDWTDRYFGCWLIMIESGDLVREHVCNKTCRWYTGKTMGERIALRDAPQVQQETTYGMEEIPTREKVQEVQALVFGED